MENASKALIIAGAILLAIVIISLGLIVVNNTRNTVDTANLNEQEIQAFNAKFSSYEGKITGARVKTLLQTVIASNQESEDDIEITAAFAKDTNSTNTEIKAGTGKTDRWISAVSAKVDLKKSYNVTLEYGTKSLVNKITIQ